MRSTAAVFFFGTILCCWHLIFADYSVAQQRQVPGVTIEAKRFADLTPDQEEPRVARPFDVEQFKELDRISITCVGKDSALVAGASIQVFGKTRGRNGKKNAAKLVASSETGNDGKCVFEDLQAQFKTDRIEGKSFAVVIRKPDYATKFLSTISWTSGEQEIQLANRAMVRGVIKNDHGQPVSNARVSFYNSLRELLPDVYATTTDEEGKFEIGDYHVVNSVAHKTRDGKTRGSRFVPLTVQHPEYGKIALMIERTPNLFFITITRGAKFTGRIVDEHGQPIGNCQISMQSHNREPSIWFETTSDGDGNFEFTKIPGVRANLFFKTANLIGNSVEVMGEKGADINLGDIKLVKPIIVKGIVIDDNTDKPLKAKEGVKHSIGWHGPEHPKTSAGISITKIQPDGTFECRFLSGKNYPYVASGALEMIDRPYKDGIEITPETNLKLEFRVKPRQPPAFRKQRN